MNDVVKARCLTEVDSTSGRKPLGVNMKRVQQGFTLIELMIVVAIIGILAAVAIPQYQDYTKKAKVANALTSVDAVKTAVALCAQEAGGVLTECDANKNGIPNGITATKEVASATIADGVITATLGTGIGTEIDGKTITFTPGVVAGDTALRWTVSTNIDSTKEPAVTQAITKNNVVTTSPSPSPSPSPAP